MIFEQIEVGGNKNFSYVIADEVTKTAIIVDPAFEVHKIAKFIEKNELKPRYVINTDSHDDHVNGNPYFKTNYPEVETVMHIATDFDVDIQIEDEAVWDVDDINLKFIHTPGHSKDSMCILINDKKLLTGSTLFVGSVGKTGNETPEYNAQQEYESLHKLIDLMDDDIEVWPGHDFGVEKSSTMQKEETSNPFLLCKTFEEFIKLKK